MKIPLPTRAIALLSGILLLNVVFPTFSQGQDEPRKLVLPKLDRETTLETAEINLHSENSDFYKNVQAAHSPFTIKREEVVVIEDTPEGPREVIREKEPPKPKDLPDAVILRSVADRLNPKGSLVTSRRSLLLFANGGKLVVGDTIPTKVRGKEYVIVVHSITASEYTLRLNDVQTTRSFKITSANSSVTRDSGND